MQAQLQNLGEASKSQRAWAHDVTSDEDEDLSRDAAIVDIETGTEHAQKSHLEELITSHGHICDFHPKYHYKLNFIEQYWNAAKFCYRSTPKTSDINEMEQNVISCLEDIPQLQILRYVVLFLAHKSSFKHAYTHN